jgi:hypothetical protein
MKAKLIYHVKEIAEDGDIIEIKIWQVPRSKDKPHGMKYSFAYVREGKRVVGYDNAEGKGDHRHVGDREIPYEFKNVDQLFADFYRDMMKLRRQNHEN